MRFVVSAPSRSWSRKVPGTAVTRRRSRSRRASPTRWTTPASGSSTSTTRRSSERRSRLATPGLSELWVPKVLRDTEVVVSMPKLKTHHWVGVTMSLKNCFGCMPGRVYGWPKDVFHVRGIPESILDIAADGAAVAGDRRRHRRHGGRRADHGRPSPFGRRRRLARPGCGGRHRGSPDGDGPGEGRLPDGGRPLPGPGPLGADRAARRGPGNLARSFAPAPGFEHIVA